ncbi:MAG: Fic family protein [Patescibacteria group bacterium]
MEHTTIKPFSEQFIQDFVLAPSVLPFTDKEIIELDNELAEYEQVFMDPEVEKRLLSKNELLASFAISKAENSTLTLDEAQEVYNVVLKHREYKFISKKLNNKQKPTVKDYEKLEFFNIAKAFREINQRPFAIKSLTPSFIKQIHLKLTQGMDIFHKYLPDFTVYKSGAWRDNNFIRVGSYVPAPYKDIPRGVKELIDWLKKNPSITSIAVFHTALYALHPFNNGNKRVCRILEHALLRSLGVNAKNLYSTSYYYHRQKERYYKYLLYSLERKNLNHFTSFMLEAFVLSIISVVKTSLEMKRVQFLDNTSLGEKEKAILKPLVKRHEVQFKTLFKLAKKNIARQTFVTYLQKATNEKLVTRREAGRTVWYTLNLKVPEQDVLSKWLGFAKARLSYIPDDIRLS